MNAGVARHEDLFTLEKYFYALRDALLYHIIMNNIRFYNFRLRNYDYTRKAERALVDG